MSRRSGGIALLREGIHGTFHILTNTARRHAITQQNNTCTWTGRGWGGYSLTYLWEASTDGGTTWTSVGTTNRYTRSFGDNESHTLSLKLTVTNDFGERPSVTWEIPVNTGCRGMGCTK